MAFVIHHDVGPTSPPIRNLPMPNLALTQVLSGAGADGVANLQSGRYEVPFGVVDVIVNEANLRFVGRDRGSAMHQHHRDAPVAVRLQRNEVVVGCAGGSGQRVIERPGQFPGPALPSTAVAGFFKQYELKWTPSAGPLVPVC
jgi:hypothetical protein